MSGLFKRPNKGNYKAKKRRRLLQWLMGDHCWRCNAAFEIGKRRESNLEMHHTQEAQRENWDPSRCSQAQRCAEYWRAWINGVLELLCKKCHGVAQRELESLHPEENGASIEQPF